MNSRATFFSIHRKRDTCVLCRDHYVTFGLLEHAQDFSVLIARCDKALETLAIRETRTCQTT